MAGSSGSIWILASADAGRVAGFAINIRQRKKTWARRSKNYAVTQAGNFLADALDHGAVVKIALLVRNDAGYGARKLHELADLRKAVRHERCDWDATDLLKRQIEDDKLGDIRQLHHDPVQRMEADFQQIQRQVVRHAIEFAVGDGAIPVEQRDSLFIFVESNSVFLRQSFIYPIALFAVAFGKFWRKWNDPIQHE